VYPADTAVLSARTHTASLGKRVGQQAPEAFEAMGMAGRAREYVGEAREDTGLQEVELAAGATRRFRKIVAKLVTWCNQCLVLVDSCPLVCLLFLQGKHRGPLAAFTSSQARETCHPFSTPIPGSCDRNGRNKYRR